MLSLGGNGILLFIDTIVSLLAILGFLFAVVSYYILRTTVLPRIGQFQVTSDPTGTIVTRIQQERHPGEFSKPTTELHVSLQARNPTHGPVYIYAIELTLPELEWPKQLLESEVELPPQQLFTETFVQPIHDAKSFSGTVEGEIRFKTSAGDARRPIRFSKHTIDKYQ